MQRALYSTSEYAEPIVTQPPPPRLHEPRLLNVRQQWIVVAIVALCVVWYCVWKSNRRSVNGGDDRL